MWCKLEKLRDNLDEVHDEYMDAVSEGDREESIIYWSARVDEARHALTSTICECDDCRM